MWEGISKYVLLASAQDFRCVCWMHWSLKSSCLLEIGMLSQSFSIPRGTRGTWKIRQYWMFCWFGGYQKQKHQSVSAACVFGTVPQVTRLFVSVDSHAKTIQIQMQSVFTITEFESAPLCWRWQPVPNVQVDVASGLPQSATWRLKWHLVGCLAGKLQDKTCMMDESWGLLL